jgi:hypothetical protein
MQVARGGRGLWGQDDPGGCSASRVLYRPVYPYGRQQNEKPPQEEVFAEASRTYVDPAHHLPVRPTEPCRQRQQVVG